MKRACFDFALALVALAVLISGCGRSSNDDKEVPYGTGYYGGGYYPNGGGSSLPGINSSGAASVGDATLSASDVEVLKSALGASNQTRLSDLLALMLSDPGNLEMIGKSVTEATQIMSRANDGQIYTEIAQIIEFFRQEMAQLKQNASQSEKRYRGHRVRGRLFSGIKGLIGRLFSRSGGGGNGGGGFR